MDSWYEWREYDDGLLKVPEQCGPYYDKDELKNNYATEEDAVADYVEFTKKHKYAVATELVLLKFYSRPKIED